MSPTDPHPVTIGEITRSQALVDFEGQVLDANLTPSLDHYDLPTPEALVLAVRELSSQVNRLVYVLAGGQNV